MMKRQPDRSPLSYGSPYAVAGLAGLSFLSVIAACAELTGLWQRNKLISQQVAIQEVAHHTVVSEGNLNGTDL